MIDIWPRYLLPRGFSDRKRAAFSALASGVALFGISGIIHLGLTPPTEKFTFFIITVEHIRNIVHPEAVPCPFCGGSRAFFSAASGNLIDALHYSFSGVLATLWLAVMGLLGFALLCLKETSQTSLHLWRGFCLLGNTRHQLMALIALWCIQLVMHYNDLFSWTAIPS